MKTEKLVLNFQTSNNTINSCKKYARIVPLGETSQNVAKRKPEKYHEKSS